MIKSEVLSYLKERLAWADASPVVPFAPNGDRNPITIEHAIMDEVLRLEAFQKGWGVLLKARTHPSVAGSISTEYPGLWIRSAIQELEKADKADKPIKKGGD